MTNKEAIEILKRLQDPEPWEPQITSATYNALKMAISALEKQEQKKPLTNDVTPIKCTELNCPMQAGKVDPKTCKAAGACAWATKPITNADRIRAMTDEELAIMIDGRYFSLVAPLENFININAIGMNRAIIVGSIG